MSLLQTCYEGVLKRLKAEVELLNAIIPHSVTKGSQNEEALKNTIRNFIPKKYSIGQGIIIDSFGNASKQIDLIIYDSYIYPSLFSQASTSLYPVETVVAAIEVKTFLGQEQLKKTAENTKSIMALKHYVNSLTINQPNPDTPLLIKSYPTRPPLSFLFAFHQDSKEPSTWKKRFAELNEYENFPEMSLLLEIACVFRFPDIAIKEAAGFQGMRLEQPERAFLGFLIAMNKLIDTYPKHTVFDPSKYLEGKYSVGTLI